MGPGFAGGRSLAPIRAVKFFRTDVTAWWSTGRLRRGSRSGDRRVHPASLVVMWGSAPSPAQGPRPLRAEPREAGQPPGCQRSGHPRDMSFCENRCCAPWNVPTPCFRADKKCRLKNMTIGTLKTLGTLRTPAETTASPKCPKCPNNGHPPRDLAPGWGSAFPGKSGPINTTTANLGANGAPVLAVVMKLGSRTTGGRG
jgi:hypothetical protein